MSRLHPICLPFVAAWLLLATGPAPQATAGLTEVIVNGGFETGNLSGWTRVEQAGSNGSFMVTGAASTPLSGLPTPGPASGSFYAVSDQDPGSPLLAAQALFQTIVVPQGSSSVLLSFEMFVNDPSGSLDPNGNPGIVDPSGLDYTSGGTGNPNQHARVDILSVGSDPLTTGAGVLRNFYLGVDPSVQPAPSSSPYTSYGFDVTDLIGGGGTFILRFAEVNNQGPLNVGVDNVSVLARSSAVPEPASWAILSLGGFALAAYRMLNSRRPV